MKYISFTGNTLAALLCLFLAKETCSQRCGEANRSMENVMPSKQAKRLEWPWMVEIATRLRNGGYSHMCSGAMITKRHVLTAAHCFRRRNPSRYTARIGHVDMKQAQEYDISQIDVPLSYKNNQLYDDIAVLTLSRDVSTPGVNPICLPKNSEYVNMTGKSVTVAGWRRLTSDGSANTDGEVLMDFPAMLVISNPKCDALFSLKVPSFRRDFKQGITDGIVCAGYLNGEKDACDTDSGGPLMYIQRDHWYVVGVSSFGVARSSCDLPGGYTRVSKYLEWILEKIKS